MRGLIVVAVLLPLASGCSFYFGDDDNCDFGGQGNFGAPAPSDPAPQFRDPFTGECDFFGGGGQIGDPCDPRALEEADRAPAEDPDFGLCFSQCTGLDEANCLDAVGCRAVHQLGLDFDPAIAPYVECWATAQSGPIQGECPGLDAYQCSRHDDCVAYHVTDFNCDAPDGADCAPEAGLGVFSSCGPERDAPQPPLACVQLGEDDCIGRADCTALYEGIDCTCQGDQCTCVDWVFDVCSLG